MDTIIIKPKNKKELDFFKTLFEQLQVEVEFRDAEHEKPYNLTELNKSVIRQKEAGTLKTIDPKNVWKSIS